MGVIEVDFTLYKINMRKIYYIKSLFILYKVAIYTMYSARNTALIIQYKMQIVQFMTFAIHFLSYFYIVYLFMFYSCFTIYFGVF